MCDPCVCGPSRGCLREVGADGQAGSLEELKGELVFAGETRCTWRAQACLREEEHEQKCYSVIGWAYLGQGQQSAGGKGVTRRGCSARCQRGGEVGAGACRPAKDWASSSVCGDPVEGFGQI